LIELRGLIDERRKSRSALRLVYPEKLLDFLSAEENVEILLEKCTLEVLDSCITYEPQFLFHSPKFKDLILKKAQPDRLA
jgi:hypothetical protein